AIAQNRERQIANIPDFNDFDGEVGQALEQALPPAADTRVPVIVALHRGERRSAFNIIVQQRQEGIQVAAIERVNASASQVHVLLRHRLSLRPRSARARSRSQEMTCLVTLPSLMWNQ